MIPVGLLSHFHMFQDVRAQDVAAVEARAERKYYRPNQLIFREGEDANALYLVEVGTVELFRIIPELSILGRVGSGGRFGDIAFLDNGKRAVSARTREATQLVSIPFSALRQLLQQRPAFAYAFYRNASRSLVRRLRQTLTDLSFARECAA